MEKRGCRGIFFACLTSRGGKRFFSGGYKPRAVLAKPRFPWAIVCIPVGKMHEIPAEVFLQESEKSVNETFHQAAMWAAVLGGLRGLLGWRGGQ